MGPPRILVTRALALDPLSVLEPLLGKAGTDFLLDAWDQEMPMSRAAFLARVSVVEAIVCAPGDQIDAELLARAPMLRAVANHAVGIDNLDRAALAARGIEPSNTPDVLTDATADLTLALLLAVARRLSAGERLIKAGNFTGWSPRMLLGLELRGSTLGLFGLGRIGSAVAERARAFGMRIICCTRKSAVARAADDQTGAQRVSFDQLLAESDVISLHCPLTDSTRHAFNASAFSKMKPGSLIINTARGPVIDEEALADALDAGTLGGAGLDVHEFEPRVNARLLAREEVLLLPHLGSATRVARQKMATLALTDAARVLRGEPPLHPAFKKMNPDSKS